jgi:hypothetical protein
MTCDETSKMANPHESPKVRNRIEREIQERERDRIDVQKYVMSSYTMSNKWNLYEVITCLSEQVQLHSLLESERKRLKKYISYPIVYICYSVPYLIKTIGTIKQ